MPTYVPTILKVCSLPSIFRHHVAAKMKFGFILQKGGRDNHRIIVVWHKPSALCNGRGDDQALSVDSGREHVDHAAFAVVAADKARGQLNPDIGLGHAWNVQRFELEPCPHGRYGQG